MNKYKPKILIVDDNPVIRSLMAGILKDEGYDLFFAVNGQDGLDQALTIHPDLIFIDLCMPVLDGIGFLRELNERTTSPCPLLAITGTEDDLVLDECFNQGIFSLIRKPFRATEIIALCRRYTKVTEIKRHLSFNMDMVTFLSQQASSFGLDNMQQRDLIEALPLPVFIKNREQVVIQVNRAFEAFTGIDRDAIVGKRCEEIGSNKEFLARSHEAELVLVKDGGSSCLAQTVTDPAGRLREVIVCRAAVTSGSRSLPVGILGVIIDVSEFDFSSYKKKLVSKFPTLSSRECEVANLVRLGMSNKEVARQLSIALCTVEYHRAHLRVKMGLKKGDNVNLSTVLLSL